MNIILILICFPLILTERLIFVMTHFRHGARSPNGLKNNIDELGEKWEGRGKLTKVGQRMHYLLGYRNRLRYVYNYNFLSEKYNSSDLYIICSTVERTQMSLSSHLQGLYPPNKDLGENLNDNQLAKSNPPVDTSNSQIQEEKGNLGNNVLPNSMTLIPFETIDIMNAGKCPTRGRSTPRQINDDGSDGDELKNQFNEKYLFKFIQFKNDNRTDNFSLNEINSLCDIFIACYTDGRTMDEFSKFIEIEDFYDFCLRVFNFSFAAKSVSTNESVYLGGTYFMGLLVNYSKLKLEEDINNLSSGNSNPKMLIISGHDSTISAQQLFLQFAFGKSMEFFRSPTFASQIAFEIIRNDDNKQNRDYSDYYINYYFNDELLLNMTVDEFFKTVEPHIMSYEETNNYCNISISNNNSSNNSSNNNNSSNEDEKNNEKIKFITIKRKKYYKAPLIVFICLFGVSLIINVFTIHKLLKRNNVSDITKQNIDNSQNNIINKIK